MFSPIYFFGIGLAFGSFINVLVLRYGTGMRLKGRSQCLSCGHTLSWYELVPLLSFIIQWGRCRRCKTRLSIQYPLIELLTGIVFAVVIARSLPFAVTVLDLVIWFYLIAIVAYDTRHKIIPNGFAYPFIALSFLRLFVEGGEVTLLNFLAGIILFIPFFCFWFFSKGRWMGLGDGKLALGIGWFLGLGAGINAIILAFWIGAAVALMLILLSRFHLFSGGKSLTMKSEVPFGPFLILGTLLVYFFNITIFVFPL